MGIPVTVSNWGADGTYYGAINQQWLNMQANADKWQQILNDRHKEELNRYYEDQDKWRLAQNAIALLQQAASFYFADKQYKAAKEAQDHQIEVWKTEKEWAKRYQDLWNDHYRPKEEAFLAEKWSEGKYEPQYDTAQARALTHIRREFGQAREKVRKCIDPRCVGYACHSLKSLAIAEAKAAVGAIEKGFRAEEARKEIEDAKHDEIIFKLLQLGRGLANDSLNALNSAAKAAEVAATYKPYAGWEAAVGNATSYWMGHAGMRAAQAQQSGSILNRQMNNYIGMGYTGNVGIVQYVNSGLNQNVTGRV